MTTGGVEFQAKTARGSGLDAGDRARGLALALAGVLLYVLLHAGFRLLASSTLGEDDTLEQILVQELRAGYNPRQPPLYDWVLYAVQQVTGPSLVSFLAIKYAALTATVVFLYLSAYRILKDRIWALLTVESLALIYQIAWRYHEGFTHEVLAMVAVTATLWAFLRLHDHGRASDFVVFGIISGLGMLTEPNYSVYQMCLWGAVVLQPAVRRRVVRPMLILSAALAIVIASTFLVWVVSDPAHFGHFFRPSERGHLRDVMIGVKDAVRGPFMYLAPLIVIVPAIFPGFLARAWADVRLVFTSAFQEEPADLTRLVLTTMLGGIVLSIFGGVVFGIGGYAMHVLMPLYVTSVIWLISVAQRSERAAKRRPVLVRVALGIAALALVARLANMFIHDPVCGKCRWGIPYATLAATLRADGLDDLGTITVADDEIGGNLRPYFPSARLVLTGPRSFVPVRPQVSGVPRAFVWDASLPPGKVADAFAGYPEAVQALAKAKLLKAPWHHLWKPDGYRTSDWKYLILR
ncbi:MAG: glycosyltransferase family 39 protein [Hyphomicrobiaceae bacterium]